MPEAEPVRCDDCEHRIARVKVTATTLEGVVLDTAQVCKPCAKDRNFQVGGK